MAYFPGRSWITWPVRGTETPGSVVTKDFVIKAETVKNLYEDTDDRRDEYFFKLDSMSHDTMYKVNQGYAYVYKWRDVVYRNVSWSPTPQVAYIDVNYSYWRLADIYLLRAECYAKLGDDLAKADLNKIRNRAHATPYPAPGENDIQLAIFKERERELLFEGHRYYDIIRNGLEYIHTYMDGNYKTLDQQDVKEGALFLPIGDEAFNLNDLIRQNIYWSRFE
ncbi:MAG: RagB/SusD family nutrient uptake outer membrane protein [Butyricimonas faecihominis]